jgi:hypothetical protein
MQNLRRRVRALEQLHPEHDGMCTVEELCRAMWRQDKTSYLKRVEKGDWHLRKFVTQFELEDAERLLR